MKKQLFYSLLFCLLAVPFVSMRAQSTVEEGQSTEGKDFCQLFTCNLGMNMPDDVF